MAQDAILNRWNVNGDIYEIQDAGRGHPLGVATLDENGRVPYTQLPESAVEFKGYWDASTNTPTLQDGTGTKGDMYYVDVAGTQDLGSGSQFFNVGDRVLYDGSVWKNMSADVTDAVTDGDMRPVTSNAVYDALSDGLANARIVPVCTTEASTQTKEITVAGFTLQTGISLRVLFQNACSADNPTLKINNESAKAIKVIRAGSKIAIPRHEGYWRGASSLSYEVWQPNTILELMYDGTDFIVVGNPIVEDYQGTNQSYLVYANGLIVLAYGGGSGTIQYLVKFSQTPSITTGLTGSSNQAIPYFAFGHSESVSSIVFSQSGQSRNYFVAIGY